MNISLYNLTPQTMSYEEFIMLNCSSHSQYISFITMLFASVVLIFLVFGLLDKYIKNNFYAIISYYIKFISEYIMFVGGLIVFYLSFIESGNAAKLRLLSFFIKLLIVAFISYIIYIVLSTPKYRDFIKKAFINKEDTPTTENTESSQEQTKR